MHAHIHRNLYNHRNICIISQDLREMFASMHVKQGEAVPGNPNPSVRSFQQRMALGILRGWEEARAWLLGPVSLAACVGLRWGGREVGASCCWLLLHPERICLLLDQSV